MRKIFRRGGVTGIAFRVVILLVAHALLIRWMAQKDTVAVIFAPGPHVPRGELLTAAAFVTVRLATLLFIPGYLLVGLYRMCLRSFTPAAAAGRP